MVKLAIPVKEISGRETKAYPHFGRAPKFYVLNTEDENKDEVIENTCNHFGGIISPVDLLINLNTDAVLSAGMGRGALDKFQSAKVPVFKVDIEAVGSIMNKYIYEELTELTDGCSHSKNSGNC